MGGGTGLNFFQKRFPDRCFDVGIAEQHAVTFAASLASEGFKPFCASHLSFLQRGYDQVCLQQWTYYIEYNRISFKKILSFLTFSRLALLLENFTPMAGGA